MHGKVLKISNNDLYGNVDDRMVALFAAFTHKKYMNKYAIFTYKDEYNKNKLYCAGVHLKEKAIVTFSIRQEELTYINKFIDEYLNNKVDSNEFEIIDISNIDKIELVSSTQIDFDKLNELDAISIEKPIVKNEEVTNKKPVFLYFLLALFTILLIGIIYLYFNPSILTFQLNKLDCSMEGYNKKIDLPYTSEAEIRFDKHNELLSLNMIDTYTFNDRVVYDDFKNNNKESIYFDINGSYKYDDENMTLKIIYEDRLIIYEYNDILRYMKKEGYSCIEGKYNE